MLSSTVYHNIERSMHLDPVGIISAVTDPIKQGRTSNKIGDRARMPAVYDEPKTLGQEGAHEKPMFFHVRMKPGRPSYFQQQKVRPHG